MMPAEPSDRGVRVAELAARVAVLAGARGDAARSDSAAQQRGGGSSSVACAARAVDPAARQGHGPGAAQQQASTADLSRERAHQAQQAQQAQAPPQQQQAQQSQQQQASITDLGRERAQQQQTQQAQAPPQQQQQAQQSQQQQQQQQQASIADLGRERARQQQAQQQQQTQLAQAPPLQQQAQQSQQQQQQQQQASIADLGRERARQQQAQAQQQTQQAQAPPQAQQAQQAQRLQAQQAQQQQQTQQEQTQQAQQAQPPPPPQQAQHHQQASVADQDRKRAPEHGELTGDELPSCLPQLWPHLGSDATERAGEGTPDGSGKRALRQCSKGVRDAVDALVSLLKVERAVASSGPQLTRRFATFGGLAELHIELPEGAGGAKVLARTFCCEGGAGRLARMRRLALRLSETENGPQKPTCDVWRAVLPCLPGALPALASLELHGLTWGHQGLRQGELMGPLEGVARLSGLTLRLGACSAGTPHAFELGTPASVFVRLRTLALEAQSARLPADVRCAALTGLSSLSLYGACSDPRALGLQPGDWAQLRGLGRLRLERAVLDTELLASLRELPGLTELRVGSIYSGLAHRLLGPGRGVSEETYIKLWRDMLRPHACFGLPRLARLRVDKPPDPEDLLLVLGGGGAAASSGRAKHSVMIKRLSLQLMEDAQVTVMAALPALLTGVRTLSLDCMLSATGHRPPMSAGVVLAPLSDLCGAVDVLTGLSWRVSAKPSLFSATSNASSFSRSLRLRHCWLLGDAMRGVAAALTRVTDLELNCCKGDGMRFAWVASLCLLLSEHGGGACRVRLVLDPYTDGDADDVEYDAEGVAAMLRARCSRVQLEWDWG
ncbi:hypothetical protein FOA52_008110 [Chlamydomonas sp. UWO 241]|nr:hypothetical protein FOA52_008110 [Chlamydomonas sp. UWO 241]